MKLVVDQIHRLNGVVTPPSSKSHTVRALLLSLLAAGTSRIKNALNADDTQAAITVCRRLGAEIAIQNNDSGGLDIVVQSQGVPLQSSTKELFTASSGITTTFIMPIAGLRQNADEPLTLTCSEQMMRRPMEPIIDALNQLGMKAESLKNNGCCPVRLSGALRGGRVTIDGLNSQPLSALLLALPCAPEDSEITVCDLHERPYAEMTLSWLRRQNIRINHVRRGYISSPSMGATDIFKIFGMQKYQPFEAVIPGDFSSASYIIAAAALLPGEVTLRGLDMDDPQGDKKLIFLLQKMGADITIRKNEIQIAGGKPLSGMTIDCNDIPDLLPTLAVIATQAEGVTTLANLAHARIKEADRIQSMKQGLTAMGAHVEEQTNSLIIHKSRLYRASMHGYNDHRTVMALAVAGLLAEGGAEIGTAESVRKTFPNFTEMMNSLGASMILTP